MFKTTNPYDLSDLEHFEQHSTSQVMELVDRALSTYGYWKQTKMLERAGLLQKLAAILTTKKDKYALQMTREMGKPIGQAVAEIEKCAWVCDHYARNGEQYLQREIINTDAKKSFVSYEPMGVILAIMPWNFPFWQLFRFFAPAVMAGNTTLLKHAPNTFGCAKLIEAAVEEAGFPRGILQNLFVEVEQIEPVIANPSVKAVTLTGSGRAGRAVASIAGRHLKKTVLELGGSNAFVVMNDANIDDALTTGLKARMQNSGQSCIAAKRFLLQRGIADEYIEKYTGKVKEMKAGDPMKAESDIGPLARVDLAEQLEQQVKKSVDMGANILVGGLRTHALYEPTVITGVRPEMPVFDEETFGPVAAFTIFEDLDHAIELVSKSEYGLGVSVFTADQEGVVARSSDFKDGALFVNDMVKSDPRLPFGGTGISGYGRELGSHGIKEFVNIKTVYVV